jgi:hypothetical protein
VKTAGDGTHSVSCLIAGFISNGTGPSSGPNAAISVNTNLDLYTEVRLSVSLNMIYIKKYFSTS